jgi:hypothetical protein
MKALWTSPFLAAVGLACAAPAFSQSADSQGGLRMPYQKDFWTTGHVGASLGQARLDADCPAGTSCDDTANAFKLFAGGRFNNTFGGEITYLNTNNFERRGGTGPGNVNLQAVNFGLLAGIPFGPGKNSSVFGKLGAMWGHTEAGSESQNGWGPSVGLGAMVGITRNLALRLDWDRWRFKLPGGGDRENIDTLMLGAQYTFGNPR